MSKPITCLHVADIHFGMENYGHTNPQTGLHTRLEDFANSLGQAVDYAIENEVDIALFAGDAYKRNSPSPTEQREFAKQFLRLAEAEIPTVMIAGNHDIPVMTGKATSIDIFRALRPKWFHVFNHRPTLDPPVIETRSGPIGVCCMPFVSPGFLRNGIDTEGLDAERALEKYQDFIHGVIEAMPAKLPDGIPKVLVAHLTAHGCKVGGYRGSPLFMDELRILPSTLANAGYSYVALGHIHRYQNLSPREDVPVVYCGSIDRVDFGEAEEEKGFAVARVEPGGAEHEFVPVKVREFVHIEVDTRKGDDITARILEEIRKEEGRLGGAVVRVTYVADDGEVHSIDMREIHRALAPAHFKAGFHRAAREAPARRRTASLSSEAALADALAAYFREHEEWRDDREALTAKALEIERTVRGEFDPAPRGDA